MKKIVIYRNRLTLAISLLLVILSFRSYSQQYLPLTGGILTGNLNLSSGVQIQGSYYGFDAPFSQPANSNSVAILANNTSNTVDFVGWSYGWRFIPNNAGAYASPVLSIDPGGNTNIVGNAYVGKNLGIGTTNPGNPLTINSANGGSIMLQNNGSSTAELSVNSNSSTWNGGSGIGLNLVATGADISLQTGNTAATALIVKNSGGVGINTTTVPAGYLFAVNGSGIATSFTVQSYANWPDYVFKKDHQLPHLSELKAYVNQNHHLPDVPSAEEVAKNGINLGEMDKILTKKVEELTLYLIEKDQQIQKQAIGLSEQKMINARMEHRIRGIENTLKLNSRNVVKSCSHSNKLVKDI